MWFSFFFLLLVLTFFRHFLSLFVFPQSISTWCDANTGTHKEKAAKWRKLARSSYLSQVHNPMNSFDSTKYFSAISWRRTSHIQNSVRIAFQMKLREAKEFLILYFAPSVSFSFHLDHRCLLSCMNTGYSNRVDHARNSRTNYVSIQYIFHTTKLLYGRENTCTHDLSLDRCRRRHFIHRPWATSYVSCHPYRVRCVCVLANNYEKCFRHCDPYVTVHV